MATRRRIALLMERLVGFNYEVLRGIRDYVGSSRPWVCHFIDPRPEYVDVVARWEPDGAIAFLGTEPFAQSLSQLGVPIVDVANWVKPTGIPQVGLDDRAIGRLAADHLIGLGYECFGFLGNTLLQFAAERRRGFEAGLDEHGFSAKAYLADPHRFPSARGWTMGGVDGQLTGWLKALSKPVAIFTDNDERGLLVSEACAAAGLSVPSDVAILGVDDDPYLCGLGYPPRSSIATPARKLGYSAAALLDEMLKGHVTPPSPPLLLPEGVVSRRSTDFYAYGDSVVSQAMRLIRDGACSGLSVPSLVSDLPVGRRTLERLFATHVGRSPGEEILRARLERARMLLATTDMSLEAVANGVGMQSAGWLSKAYEMRYGIRPRQFRQSF